MQGGELQAPHLNLVRYHDNICQLAIEMEYSSFNGIIVNFAEYIKYPI